MYSYYYTLCTLPILIFDRKFKILNKFSIPLNVLLAGSILSLTAILGNKSFLNHKVFSYLNKIGFGIYLLHMPIICIVGFYMYRHTSNLIIVIGSVCAVLIIASLLFHFFIEKKMRGMIINRVSGKRCS